VKILYVLGFLPTYVHREIAELVKMGHDIHVLLPEESTNASHKLWNDITGSKCSCSISRCMPFRLFTSSSMPLFFPFLHSLPHLTVFLSSLKEGETRYFLTANETCRALPKGWIPNVIHSHFAKDQAHIARILSKLLKMPYLITTHATDIFVPKDTERLKRVLRDAHAVVTISDFNKSYMRERGFTNKDATVVKLGVNRAELPERVNPSSLANGVCVASGLVEKKGIEVLLMAVSDLKEEFPQLHIKIIGSDPDGTLLNDYRLRSERLPVEFTGALPSSKTLKIVSEAGFFVLPCVRSSTGDMDGIPVSIMEAMAMGVPVVSTAISGIPELITHGETGLLARPGSPESLTEMIQRMLASPEEAEEMGRRGRERVLSLHSPQRSARELTEVFNRAVEAHRKGAKK